MGGTRRHIAKLLSFWLQVEVYSVVPYAILLATHQRAFSFDDLLTVLLPLTRDEWWFVSAYFIILAFYPLLNIVINALDKKELRLVIIGMLAVSLGISSFVGKGIAASNVGWFICLYFIAAYLKKYNVVEKISIRMALIVGVIVLLVTWFSAIVILMLGEKIPSISGYFLFFYAQDKWTIVIISICLLIIFLKLDLGSNKITNFIAEGSLAIYLLHANPYMSKMEYSLIAWQKMYTEPYFVAYALLSVLICVVICLIVDVVYRLTIGQIIKFICNKLD